MFCMVMASPCYYVPSNQNLSSQKTKRKRGRYWADWNYMPTDSSLKMKMVNCLNLNPPFPKISGLHCSSSTRERRNSSTFFQRLQNIRENIICMFKTDRDANETGSDAHLLPFRFSQFGVCCRC